MSKAKNIGNFTLHIIVVPHEGGYLAMCKETGLIRGGSTLVEARDAIFSSTKTLIEAISKNHKLVDSLTVGLPLRYRIFFDFLVFKMFVKDALSRMNNMLYLRQPVSGFQPVLS